MSNPFAPPGDEQTRPAPPEGASEPISQSARGFDHPVSTQPPPTDEVDPNRRGQQRPRPPLGQGGQGGSGGPNGPGSPRPARRTPTPEDIAAFKATQRPVLIFAGLMTLALLATGLPLPWGIAGLVFVLAALIAGVRAFIVVLRSRRGGMMLPVIGMLMVFTLTLGALVGQQILLWQPTIEHQECVRLAITVESKDECAANYEKAWQDYVDQHFPGLMPSPKP